MVDIEKELTRLIIEAESGHNDGYTREYYMAQLRDIYKQLKELEFLKHEHIKEGNKMEMKRLLTKINLFLILFIINCGESDRATHEEEFTLELRTRERERKLLSKISESIEDLKSDDYGYCASCGIEIGIRRLEARPTATRCIDCKTIEEIHERQQYG